MPGADPALQREVPRADQPRDGQDLHDGGVRCGEPDLPHPRGRRLPKLRCGRGAVAPVRPTTADIRCVAVALRHRQPHAWEDGHGESRGTPASSLYYAALYGFPRLVQRLANLYYPEYRDKVVADQEAEEEGSRRVAPQTVDSKKEGREGEKEEGGGCGGCRERSEGSCGGRG